MNTMFQQLLDLYLQSTPTPSGMASRDIVRKSIEFAHPPRIPFSFITPIESDFFEVAAVPRFSFLMNSEDPRDRVANIWVSEHAKKKMSHGDTYHDEWGVGWECSGRLWDHSFYHPLSDLAKLDDYRFPVIATPERFDLFQPYVEQAHTAGKYVVGFDPILLYERMRALMGFEELMIAPYTQPDGLHALLDCLTDLEIAVIEQWTRIGNIDAYMTWDDWGLQTSLQMSPSMFREHYKPRYARIIEAAHNRGMHYIWHNCGYITDMIEDMIEIGVDVLQLDQPRLMGYQELANRFGGRICFWNTVDIQWATLQHPTEIEIKNEVACMTAAFNRFGGGFMARQYADAMDIEMPPERDAAIYEAFMQNGCALPVI